MVWLRPEQVPIREFHSADGLKSAVIFRRPDGNFGYACEYKEQEDGETFWSPLGGSGIYESFEAAERAALSELPWLYDGKSN